MGVKDTKKIFDAFYIRFITVIILLKISEREKIEHLRRLLANRLKYHILDYSIFTSYYKLITRL